MKSPERDLTTTLPSAENGSTGLYLGASPYQGPTIEASPNTFQTVSLGLRVHRGIRLRLSGRVPGHVTYPPGHGGRAKADFRGPMG